MDATCAMDENMPRESLGEALAYVGDLADICAEGACITRLGLEESKLEEAARATEHGAGTRVFYSSLYVTGTMNTGGINLINGDYSARASGLCVERGEVVGPVNGVTIAGSMVHMLGDVFDVASDLCFVPIADPVGVPTMLVQGMTVGGRQINTSRRSVSRSGAQWAPRREGPRPRSPLGARR